jgi:hypothetical protein
MFAFKIGMNKTVPPTTHKYIVFLFASDIAAKLTKTERETSDTWQIKE